MAARVYMGDVHRRGENPVWQEGIGNWGLGIREGGGLMRREYG